MAATLVGLSGEPTQRWSYSALSVNDRPTTTRLVLEVPDKTYAKDLGTGVLYKALSTGSFTYQGEDPIEYADDFDQTNRKGSQDLPPVIDLIRWVEEASDEEFAAELDEHIDVASFTRYVALQNLLLNFDDMAGPGRTYYLFYDLDRRIFTVVTWDLNLAFSGDPNQGPFDAGSLGGSGGQFPGGQLPGGRFPGAGQFPGRPVPRSRAGAGGHPGQVPGVSRGRFRPVGAR